jgi:glycosyltransferase involved in cell wall biosynthesis
LNTVVAAPDISIIIPSFGPTPYLRELVNSIKNQTVQACEIIVAHSGTCDPTQWLHNPDDGVKVIHSELRWLPGAARNAGAQLATGEWLAFVDSDILPESTWLDGFIRASHRIPQPAVFVGSLSYGKEDGYWGRCLWYVESGSVHPYRKQHLMASAPGANFMIKRVAFEKIEGFPADMLVAEDAQFFVGLRKMDHKIVFTPEAQGAHQYNSKLKSYFSRLFELGEGAAHIRLIFDLPGSVAARYPLLALGLWMIRYLQICKRVIENHGPVGKLIKHSPGILLGLISWSAGFLKQSVRHSREESRKLDDN